MQNIWPNDFLKTSAAPLLPRRIELIYLSSHEEDETNDLSITSVMDLQLSSEDDEYDDEIMMMTQCVEMELSGPIPVPGPSSSRLDYANMLDNLKKNETP